LKPILQGTKEFVIPEASHMYLCRGTSG